MISLLTLKTVILDLLTGFKYIGIIFLIAWFFHTKTLYTKNKQLDIEIGRLMNNLNRQEHDNKILQLTLDEFKQSSDSLIIELDSIRKELNIKDKELNTMSIVKTVFNDTSKVIVPLLEKPSIPKLCDFDIEIKPNDLTYFRITRVNEELEHIARILNKQYLYYNDKKVYRRQRKNFFDRLIHFDFKKDVVLDFKIENTNDKIEVVETIAIKISK